MPEPKAEMQNADKTLLSVFISQDLYTNCLATAGKLHIPLRKFVERALNDCIKSARK